MHHMTALRRSSLRLCRQGMPVTLHARVHRFADKEVQRDSKMVSYKVVDKIGKPYVSVNIAGEEKTYSPEEISAMVLTKVSATAQACNSLS